MALDRYQPYFSDFEWPWYMPSTDDYEAVAGQSKLRKGGSRLEPHF